MKKISALLLAVWMLVGCCASAFAADETEHIVFWYCMSEDAGVLVEEYVNTFNSTIGAENGIEVEAVYQGSYSEATQKLNSILSAGNLEELPDVMQMDATGKVTYFNSGAAYTVDAALADYPESDLSNMLESAMGNWNYAGTQLGVPFATSTTVTYYNKSLLDAAGMDAPETFADIAAIAAAMPETAENGNALLTYATVPNTPTLANWLGQLGSYVVDNKNGSEGSAAALACIDNGALATFLTEWKAMYESGALTNAAGSSDEFVAGSLVLLTGSSSNIAANLARIGGAFEMGVTTFPKVNADASFGATVSGSCLVMFDKENKAASWTLVQYLTGAEVQADFAAGTGYIPSNKGALDTDAWKTLTAENPLYNVGLEQLMNTPADMRSVTVGPSADFYYGIQNCITEMLDEDLDVEEAVEIMADELGGLLDQYNAANS